LYVLTQQDTYLWQSSKLVLLSSCIPGRRHTIILHIRHAAPVGWEPLRAAARRKAALLILPGQIQH
jgi:hypothetical protein